MENKTTPLYMLVFCYAVFSFAVYIPDTKMNLYSWLTVLIIALFFKTVFLFLTEKGRILKQLRKPFEFYLVFLLAFQTNKIFRYLRLYHNKNAETIVIVTIFIILIFVVFKDVSIYRFAKPLFWFSVILILMAVALNINKAKVYNLFSHYKLADDVLINSITLFDYIIPMCLIRNSMSDSGKHKSVKVMVTIDLILFFLIFFVFFCFRGDLMYSISPLQMVFQLSGSSHIRNFDAMYSFMLIMLYFASIVLILWAIKEIKQSNRQIKYGVLFLYLLFFCMSFLVTDSILLAIHLAGIIMFMGGRNFEKS